MIRQTHTVATLEVSVAAYEEIARLLRDAQYGHAFMNDGVIDMTGIGLARPGCNCAAKPGDAHHYNCNLSNPLPCAHMGTRRGGTPEAPGIFCAECGARIDQGLTNGA